MLRRVNRQKVRGSPADHVLAKSALVTDIDGESPVFPIPGKLRPDERTRSSPSLRRSAQDPPGSSHVYKAPLVPNTSGESGTGGCICWSGDMQVRSNFLCVWSRSSLGSSEGVYEAGADSVLVVFVHDL